MRLFKTWPVRLLAFLAVLALLLGAVDFLLYVPNAKSAIVMHDLYRAQDSEIVALGNSLCYVHIDPAQVEAQLGMPAFTLGVDAARTQTLTTLAREVFRIAQPRMLLFVYDPTYHFFPDEDISVYANLFHDIESPAARLRYMLTSLKGDLTDVNRFFPWRHAIATLLQKENSFERWKEFLGYKLDRELFLKDCKEMFAYTYRGRGFFAQAYQADQSGQIDRNRPASDVHDGPLPDDLKRAIREIKALCDQNGCELIVITSPHIQNVVLAERRYRQSFSVIDEYLASIGVPYYNFTYAREELLSHKTLAPLYYDAASHLNEEGADLFTRALCRVLAIQQAGGDAKALFYTEQAWLDTIDYVSNLWLERADTDEGALYTAWAGCGPAVRPEYRFAAIREDGTEETLQDWSPVQTCLIGW